MSLLPLISPRARAGAALFVAASALLTACGSRPPSDSELAARDSARLVELPGRLASIPAPIPASTRDSLRAAALASRQRTPRLSPLADSIAGSLVFMVNGRDAFTAAVRAKRLLIDIGRVDAKLKSPERLAAYHEAVSSLAPVRPGERFRLRGPWGAEPATVKGFDVWNGRIVATLALSPRLDSLARARDPLVAIATRGDTAIAPDSCVRDSLGALLSTRVQQVGDSVELALRGDTAALSERLRRTLRVQRSQATGCFGGARALLLITASAGAYEWVREVALLVDPRGAAMPLRVRDPNFGAHEALHAFDADGDGVDDLATRARRERGGGTSILRLDVAGKRLDRVTSGFVWEG
jgi:hypothetical protein